MNGALGVATYGAEFEERARWVLKGVVVLWYFVELLMATETGTALSLP